MEFTVFYPLAIHKKIPNRCMGRGPFHPRTAQPPATSPQQRTLRRPGGVHCVFQFRWRSVQHSIPGGVTAGLASKLICLLSSFPFVSVDRKEAKPELVRAPRRAASGRRGQGGNDAGEAEGLRALQGHGGAGHGPAHRLRVPREGRPLRPRVHPRRRQPRCQVPHLVLVCSPLLSPRSASL